MLSLLDLPHEIVHTVPWDDADLWSVLLTCRLFNHLFTPRLYESFEAELYSFDLDRPGELSQLLGFIRSISLQPQLSRRVHNFSLDLIYIWIDNWNCEQFKCIVSEFGISEYFRTSEAGTPAEPVSEEMEDESRDGVSKASASYGEEDFAQDVGYLLLSRLTELRRIDISYSRGLSVFDSHTIFQHLIEVKIRSDRYGTSEYGAGDDYFDDAVSLLSSPKLRKVLFLTSS